MDGLKRRASVKVDHLDAVEEQQQVRSAISVDILELDRHRHLGSLCSGQRRSHVDVGVRGVACCQFDHLQVPIQVNRDKVTWVSERIAVANHRIGLIGTG